MEDATDVTAASKGRKGTPWRQTRPQGLTARRGCAGSTYHPAPEETSVQFLLENKVHLKPLQSAYCDQAMQLL